MQPVRDGSDHVSAGPHAEEGQAEAEEVFIQRQRQPLREPALQRRPSLSRRVLDPGAVERNRRATRKEVRRRAAADPLAFTSWLLEAESRVPQSDRISEPPFLPVEVQSFVQYLKVHLNRAGSNGPQLSPKKMNDLH